MHLHSIFQPRAAATRRTGDIYLHDIDEPHGIDSHRQIDCTEYDSIADKITCLSQCFISFNDNDNEFMFVAYTDHALFAPEML